MSCRCFRVRRATRTATASLTVLRLNRMMRDWVAALPSLLGPDGNEFDRRRVIAYAFRHTFAQRHADAGTPVEVLADLLGHDDLKSTQGYYEVSDQRKRLAIDQLRPLQLDRGGDETPFVERLVESQRQRQRVGQIAVTFGGCAEPSNVRASGQACPFRHRCFGCEHFRTDPSYLPELKTHLNQLLADREGLAIQAPELAEWARRDARPAEEEIAAVQRLVRRCEAKLGELPDGERDAVEEAIVVLRRARAQLDRPRRPRRSAARDPPDQADAEPARRRRRSVAVTDRTEAMRQQRSLSSTHKFERVIAVTRALLERGDEPAMAEIARRAEVSRNFLYKPEVRHAIAAEVQTAGEQLSARLTTSSRVTAASLRAELENYKAQNGRLRDQLRQLEGKLSRVLGVAVLDELPLDDHREIGNEARLQQRVEQLESEAFELREALADREEQLEAVRTINRELVAQQNRP